MHWWNSLVGESAIVALFIGLSAFVAWCIEQGSLNKPNQQKSQAVGPNTATNDGDDGTKPVLRTEVDVLHTLIDEYTTRDSQSYTLQRRNFWLGVVTVIIVFGYTTVAALQWCTMVAANKQAAKTFIATQRPYVSVGQRPDGSVATFEQNPFGQNYVVNLFLINTGHLPASTIRVAGGLNVDIISQKHKLFHLRPIPPHPVEQSMILDIPAESTREFTIGDLMFTESEMLAYRKGDKRLWIRGIYEFVDAFDEYCCKEYCINWNNAAAQFRECATLPPEAIVGQVCPTYPNICEE